MESVPTTARLIVMPTAWHFSKNYTRKKMSHWKKNNFLNLDRGAAPRGVMNLYWKFLRIYCYIKFNTQV